MPLLIAGGQADPNLAALTQATERAGIGVIDFRMPPGASLAFRWSLDQNELWLSGERVLPKGAFLRHDVFEGMRDSRPAVAARSSAWSQTVYGWLLAQPGVRIFNRQMSQVALSKPAVLLLAREAGLRIPSTLITNETAGLVGYPSDSWIAKPVAGGDFCYTLGQALSKSEARGLAAMPAIVQSRMIAPEIRIYVVGGSEFAFEVRSKSLDYRVEQDAELIVLSDVPSEVKALRRLMSTLGMDFGAADFKTDPANGELAFLELNTSPMFARFDYSAEGRLCAAMVRELASD